eukprot:gnl/Hemi2/26368_TR8850_c0_g1_i1.p1 gnl/Hemi2/26368_TR8850_c0_g1~~gnl/Hemi2/26368_TR8850_c0_g1_i1.p1  ORF type:complete len:346 (-),score=93.92 gnl/Hemi2/26368_TR8850_c0_g1_i1:71-1108(-)
MATEWCTIESDPGVFSELISEIGVQGCQVEELYSLDSSVFRELGPVHGLIFLFKWRHSEKDSRSVDIVPGLFFANQVINNACATQAILAILLNRPQINIGPVLTNFKEMTMDFEPEMRGHAISNVEVIRTAHNSFARPEPFVLESKKATEEDDVYHFISYVPFNGFLYELDGLKSGPINLGACTEANWVEVATPEIQRRIDLYSQSEIRFNVMAVVKDQRLRHQEKIDSLTSLRTNVELRQAQLANPSPYAMEICLAPEVAELGSVEAAQAKISQIEREIRELHAKIHQEADKWAAWRTENIRRRHNYVPFIINMLRILARKGQLKPLIERAKAKRSATHTVKAN